MQTYLETPIAQACLPTAAAATREEILQKCNRRTQRSPSVSSDRSSRCSVDVTARPAAVQRDAADSFSPLPVSRRFCGGSSGRMTQSWWMWGTSPGGARTDSHRTIAWGVVVPVRMSAWPCRQSVTLFCSALRSDSNIAAPATCRGPGTLVFSRGAPASATGAAGSGEAVAASSAW